MCLLHVLREAFGPSESPPAHAGFVAEERQELRVVEDHGVRRKRPARREQEPLAPERRVVRGEPREVAPAHLAEPAEAYEPH